MRELLYRVKGLEHIKLAAIFVALNMLDAILTGIVLNAGGTELNPLMRYLWERPKWAVWSVEIVSTIVVAFALLVLAVYSPRFIRVVLIVLIIYMAVVCAWGGLCLLRV